MNKVELVEAIVKKTALTKKNAEMVLKAFEEVVTETLVIGEKVQLVGFGTFEVAERAAREGRNPSTGKPLHIAARKVPKFKPGKLLKLEVDK